MKRRNETLNVRIVQQAPKDFPVVKGETISIKVPVTPTHAVWFRMTWLPGIRQDDLLVTWEGEKLAP